MQPGCTVAAALRATWRAERWRGGRAAKRTAADQGRPRHGGGGRLLSPAEPAQHQQSALVEALGRADHVVRPQRPPRSGRPRRRVVVSSSPPRRPRRPLLMHEWAIRGGVGRARVEQDLCLQVGRHRDPLRKVVPEAPAISRLPSGDDPREEGEVVVERTPKAHSQEHFHRHAPLSPHPPQRHELAQPPPPRNAVVDVAVRLDAQPGRRRLGRESKERVHSGVPCGRVL